MWIFLFFLLLQSNPAPCQMSTATEQPSMVVQVVDSNWMPIHGADVNVETLAGRVPRVSNHTHTDDAGYAKLFALPESDYSIDVKIEHFQDGHIKLLHLFKGPSGTYTAYVQLRLEIGKTPPTVVN